MAQSFDESKMKKGPVAISRDYVPRDFESEKDSSGFRSEFRAQASENLSAKPESVSDANSESKSNFQSPQSPQKLDSKFNRRDFFKSAGPASGKALTGFLRNFKVSVATVIEEVKSKKSD
jgi:hypothetical protein